MVPTSILSIDILKVKEENVFNIKTMSVLVVLQLHTEKFQMPLHYIQKTDSYSFQIATALECMKSYFMAGTPNTERYHKLKYNVLAPQMFGRMMPIKSAPHFSKLKMFGGDIGIDDSVKTCSRTWVQRTPKT